MKKLALLLLAFLLGACTTAAPTPQNNAQATYIPPNSLIARSYSPKPIPKLTLQWIAQAETHCRAGNVGSSDPQYGQCVNGYLQDQYGVTLFRDQTGALQVAYPNTGFPSPDATSAFAAPFMSLGPQTTPPPGR